MDCIFCKIIAGVIPTAKIRENDDFIAILDAFPACRGQTLVMPKIHHDSDIFIMSPDMYSKLMLAARDVVGMLKAGLGVEKVGLVVEGLQVPHAHVKLYPFRGGKSFEGGLTGHTMADAHDLQNLAEQIDSKL